jgi:6-phosphogluconate dehydrogenase
MPQQSIGFIGLGKMGVAMTSRLIEHGWTVAGHDPNSTVRVEGVMMATSITDLVAHLREPRTVWIMVPHTAVEGVLDELVPLLASGDTVVDGGNTPYADSVRRAEQLAAKGIRLLDVGVSGGPRGAREGACLMVGGERSVFEAHEALFRDLAAPDGYAYVGVSGAGHFVKMIHNGIEYGMMQAIAEGFALLRASDFKPSLTDIAELFSHRSVIESRLVGHLSDGFHAFGEELAEISGTVAASGEGAWTVAEAEKIGVSVPAIKTALDFRTNSYTNPSYTGKLLSMLRNRFGGHAAG